MNPKLPSGAKGLNNAAIVRILDIPVAAISVIIAKPYAFDEQSYLLRAVFSLGEVFKLLARVANS